MSESLIKKQGMVSLSQHCGCKVFNNPVGRGWVGSCIGSTRRGILLGRDARMVPYGLHEGSPDVIGWRPMTVDSTWMGRRVAVFVGIEFKSPGGYKRPAQKTFIDALQDDGALAGFAESVTEACQIVTRMPWESIL
jgi:VRR-NUC domain